MEDKDDDYDNKHSYQVPYEDITMSDQEVHNKYRTLKEAEDEMYRKKAEKQRETRLKNKLKREENEKELYLKLKEKYKDEE